LAAWSNLYACEGPKPRLSLYVPPSDTHWLSFEPAALLRRCIAFSGHDRDGRRGRRGRRKEGTYERSKEGGKVKQVRKERVKGHMSVAEKAQCESRASARGLVNEGAGPPEDEQPWHDGAAGPASTWELDGEEEGEPSPATLTLLGAGVYCTSFFVSRHFNYRARNEITD